MQSKYVPNTSFSKRLAITQLMSYFLYTSMVVCYFWIIYPELEHNIFRIAITACFTVVAVSTVVFCLRCSLQDPSDPMVRMNIQSEYLASEHGAHLYCRWCRCFIRDDTSKHCRVCDRCCEGFDHHCIWINNCIGSNNYRSFFTMVVSICTSMAIYLASAGLIVYKHITKVQIVLWKFGLAMAISALLAAAFLLLFNLVIFHIYLFHKGLTTYDFLQISIQEKPKTQRNIQKSRKNIKISAKLRLSALTATNQQVQIQVKPIKKPTILKPIANIHEKGTDSQRNKESKEQKQQKNQSVLKQDEPSAQSIKIDRLSEAPSIGVRCIKDKNSQDDQPYVQSELENGQGEEGTSVKLSRFFTKNPSLRLLTGGQNQTVDYGQQAHKTQSNPQKGK